MAPSYIIDLIHIKAITRYSLRSTEGVLLKHPSGRMKKSFGNRSFSVAAPPLWNALPVSLRMIKCISTSKSNVKTSHHITSNHIIYHHISSSIITYHII